VPVF
jgi:hypothetical protein